MSNLLKDFSDISDDDRLILLDCIARKRDLPKANQEFQRQRPGQRIESSFMVRFALTFRDEIRELRRNYEGQIEDMPGASYRDQMEYLEEIREAAMEEKVVGVGAGGRDIIKQELAVARSCVEMMWKIRLAWDVQKEREKNVNKDIYTTDGDQKGPTLQVTVRHTKAADPLFPDPVPDEGDIVGDYDDSDAGDLGLAAE